ncbi:MAG: histidinol-phosphate transaminase [Bacteroidota bacterium]
MQISTLVRKNIQQLAPYSSARHEFVGSAEVYLDANENPYDTGFNRYPDPLQKAVKEKLSTIKKIAPEHIFLGNGSDEAIDLLIRIFCEPRIDHILTLPPTYGMYKVSASIADVQVKNILLTPDYQPNVEEILEVADERSKLLFLCTPNNPTGNRFERAKVLELLEKFKGVVVIDEAYIDFSAEESYNQLLEKYPNLVVMQTFSKAWGMAAIRLGIAYASKEIIHYFNKVKPPYNVNILTQQAALKALENYEQQQAVVREILEERAKLMKALPAFSFVQNAYPSDANFILIKVEKPNELYKYLVGKGIIVRNRSNVPLCEGGLRITVGTKLENEQLMAAMKAYRVCT